MKYYIPTGNWPLAIDYYHQLLSEAGLEESTVDEAQVLVLPGGADIGMRPERDRAEFALYTRWTMEKQPVLGICRGMQLMLHLHDGDLIEHIPDCTTERLHTTISGDWRGQSAWHTTNLGLLTNSRHHQGYTSVPDFWEVIDQTPDGIIEAVCHANQFGVQWHPEHSEMAGTAAREWWIEKAIEVVNYDKNLQC